MLSEAGKARMQAAGSREEKRAAMAEVLQAHLEAERGFQPGKRFADDEEIAAARAEQDGDMPLIQEVDPETLAATLESALESCAAAEPPATPPPSAPAAAAAGAVEAGARAAAAEESPPQCVICGAEEPAYCCPGCGRSL